MCSFVIFNFCVWLADFKMFSIFAKTNLNYLYMSTNYYLTRVRTEKSAEKLQGMFLDGVSTDEIKEYLDQFYEGIHIGKYSCGWKFVIAYNKWQYFTKDLNSFFSWIKTCLDSGEWFMQDDNGGVDVFDSETAIEILKDCIESGKDGKHQVEGNDYFNMQYNREHVLDHDFVWNISDGVWS